MNNLEVWADKNMMELNAKRTKEMWMCHSKSIPPPDPLKISNITLGRVSDLSYCVCGCKTT